MNNTETTKKRKLIYTAIGAIGVSALLAGGFVLMQSEKTTPHNIALMQSEEILNKDVNSERINNIATQLEQAFKGIKNEADLKSLIKDATTNEYGILSIKGVEVYSDIHIDSVECNFYSKDHTGDKLEKTNICKPTYIHNMTAALDKTSNNTGNWYIDITTPIFDDTGSIGEVTTTLEVTNVQGVPKKVKAPSVELHNDKEVMIAKPIIYLYPEKASNVKVSLDYDGDLYVTYPDYNKDIKGWDVTAYPDGKIINNDDNLEYSYLFWDGFSDKLNPTFEEGFIVKGSQTKAFLQNILPKMGLTPKEYNEFIVYWLPLMQNNEYNVISFLEDEYTDIAKLNVTPKPDSILRVFMAFKGINELEAEELRGTIKEQKIKPFKRTGFSVVEWGGTEVK